MNIKLSDHKEYIDKSISEVELLQNMRESLSYCKDTISINLNFDNCGIGSIKFVFNITKDVETPILIAILDNTSTLVDGCLFDLFKEDLKKVLKEKEGFILFENLIEHLTYSIVSGEKIKGESVAYKKRDLFGVAWNTKYYRDIDERIVDKIFENNIPVYRDDVLLVTKQSTLMISSKNDHEEFIEAIELFWRQQCLIKKIDFQIMGLLNDIMNNNKKDLNSQIKLIINTQTSLNLDLEIYRNTILSIVQTYAILFETLNKVFNTNNHYLFVKSKMEDCKQIYQQLYDKKQENLIYNIQMLVFILGILTLISTISLGIFDKQLKELNIFISFCLILIGIGLLMGFCFLYNKNKHSKEFIFFQH